MTDEAERTVEAAIRAALPPAARAYANVRLLARTRPTGPAHDAEADLVVLHPDHGLLVVEVKGGEPGRDALGRWYAGGRQLERSPFEQAAAAKHDFVRAVEALPGGPCRGVSARGSRVAADGARAARAGRGPGDRV
jgi:hypothetical protein